MCQKTLPCLTPGYVSQDSYIRWIREELQTNKFRNEGFFLEYRAVLRK